MLVNSVNNTCKSQNNKACLNFKQGLTRDIVTHVKNMAPDEYTKISHRLWKKYDMFADMGHSNAVAFCVEQTADIMSKAGFTLPKYFKFRSISSNDWGQYDITGSVLINADNKEFLDLVQLNKSAEQSNCYNDSKHFLDTYLHEFLHAAHFNNIVKRTSADKGVDIFFNDFSAYTPCNSLQNPLISFITHLYPTMTKKQVKSIFPEKEKLFSPSDLAEYFAEKNAKMLETELGKNLNINNVRPNIADIYVGFPENWCINDEVRTITKMPFIKRVICGKLNPSERDERIKATLERILNYFEGEIWNGNIDGIKDKSTAFRDYGTSKLTREQ